MERIHEAKVTGKTTVNDEPTKIGDIVMVDFHTLRNLAAEGKLQPTQEVKGVTFVPEKKEKP